MGRQKPRTTLSLAQNHKQFKQRVHILNSALSNQANLKTNTHHAVDEDSFLSKQTKNTSTFTPNLMECILFPIFQSTHSTTHSPKTVDLKHLMSKRTASAISNSKRKHNNNNNNASNTDLASTFPSNFDIDSKVFMNTAGPQPLHQSADHFTNWQSQLLIQHTQRSLNEYAEYQRSECDQLHCDEDVYIPVKVESHWPSTYGDSNSQRAHSQSYLNPNLVECKESPYDVMMLKCAQQCYGRIIYNELTFDDFTNFIDTRYNYHYWTYHRDERDVVDEQSMQSNRKRLHFNKRMSELYESINHEVKNAYFTFLQKEVEFRLLMIMGNRRLLNTQRSSHISPLSLFSIQKKLSKMDQVMQEIDLKQVHLLADTTILKWTKSIRDCLASIECMLREMEQMKYNLVAHLYQFPVKFKKYLSALEQKIRAKNEAETHLLHSNNKEKGKTEKEDEIIPLTLIYVYKTDEQFHHDSSGYHVESENMYKDESRHAPKNEYSVHIDLELCDFAEYLNFYRYLLTVIKELKSKVINEYEERLNTLLKYVAAEIQGSIWNRQIWEGREHESRIKKDEQLCKKLLFVGNNNNNNNNKEEMTMSLMRKYLSFTDLLFLADSYRMAKVGEIQEAFLKYVRQILNDNEIEPSALAIHIKLNLLNNNEHVKFNLLKPLYDIIHDRDRPRGIKPSKTLKKIREKAKLLLLKKEREIQRKKKTKKIRIQTSEKHLSKLANITPTASDIQQKYHDAILKQRQQKRMFLIGQKRKRDQEIAEMKRKRKRKSLPTERTKQSGPPPALEMFQSHQDEQDEQEEEEAYVLDADGIHEPALKKRRKSERIESQGGHKSFVEPEIEQFIEYQFEFAIVSEWNEFLKSNIFERFEQDDILSDVDAFKRMFELLFLGMHVDVADEYQDWYEGIIDKVRISAKKAPEELEEHAATTQNEMESDCKTQSINTASSSSSHQHELEIFNRYHIKLRVHFKNFSQLWDTWIDLPSTRISALRTYSNAYDVDDNVKPLAEVLRELDESHIVSTDFIADSLQLDRAKFAQWINSEQVEWQKPAHQVVDDVLRWTKHFLITNKGMHEEEEKKKKGMMMIARDYFVKAGSLSNKRDHMLCEAVLPHTLDMQLVSLSEQQQSEIQHKVIALRQQNKDYFAMSGQCGIPLGLFQQIVFGITDLLPNFITTQMLNWCKGIPIESLDLAVKEDQLFYVKIE